MFFYSGVSALSLISFDFDAEDVKCYNVSPILHSNTDVT